MMINKDAFSNGQIASKLWLCQEIEKLGWSSQLTHIYGGWHGILAFLLLSREKFCVDRIESFDLDPVCESIADMINNNWVINNWQFKAHTADCDFLDKTQPDLIINTSSEHFDSMLWFDSIPKDKRVIIQGNDMPHDDHVVHSTSLGQFIDTYPLSETIYSGFMEFSYPDWSFTRYMIIGTK
jgi:hypothetical protein